MKPLLAFVVIVCNVLVPTTFARTPAEGAEWLELEAAWNDAHLRGDLAALEELWADDLSIVVPKMAPFDKARSTQVWRAIPVKFTRYESMNVNAKLYGQTAVVTGTIVRDREFGGRKANDRWIFTKVYVQQGSAWRVVAFHASEAPE